MNATSVIDRRRILGAAACAALVPLAATANAGALVGAAAMKEDFLADSRYRDALIRHCDVIVPMNDLKWEAVHPERNRFNFEDADRLLDFAREHGKSTRGHALLWYNAMPSWTREIASTREAERELRRHIEQVAGRYAGKITSWDVVNEVLSHDPAAQGTFRDTLWRRWLGAEQVDLAFRAASQADPKAELVFNDYDFEFRNPRCARRREETLAIVRRLQDRKISIHAVGLQCHIYGEQEIDRDGLARFSESLARLGIGVLVTELDVIDWKMPADIAERDRLAAAKVDELLGALASGGPIRQIISWGITDRYSWIRETFPRPDGRPNRPLPLDENYRPKPMHAAIGRFRKKA
ncbi:MAG: endo-1,4-beta-xylanase [Beijerinckiaceae bacterium]